MENREYLNRLFDIYRGLLTEVEQDTFINYYKEDLSLSEIAFNKNITRSGVSKTLGIVEKKLNNYEKLLKIEDIKKKLNKGLNNKDLDYIEKVINNW